MMATDPTAIPPAANPAAAAALRAVARAADARAAGVRPGGPGAVRAALSRSTTIAEQERAYFASDGPDAAAAALRTLAAACRDAAQEARRSR